MKAFIIGGVVLALFVGSILFFYFKNKKEDTKPDSATGSTTTDAKAGLEQDVTEAITYVISTMDPTKSAERIKAFKKVIDVVNSHVMTVAELNSIKASLYNLGDAQEQAKYQQEAKATFVKYGLDSN